MKMKSPYDQEIYSLRRVGDDYYITKWNGYLELIVTHHMFKANGKWHCDCMRRSASPVCRHDAVLNMFFMANKVNTGWFYHWGVDKWEPPLNAPPQLRKEWVQQCLLSDLKESIASS
jgi:hypothetical protein